jgi:hypothetical protein
VRRVILKLGFAAAVLLVLVVVGARIQRERHDTALANLALEVLKQQEPSWSVTRSGPLELSLKVAGAGAVLHLENAASAAGGDPNRFRELVAESARNLAEALDERPPPSLDAARARLRPVLVPAAFADAQGVARRPFAGDVVEAWVFDSPHHMTYVMQDQPATWKVDLVAVHEAASSALWATVPPDIPEPESESGAPGRFLTLTTPEHYAASRLALAAARAAIAKRLGTPFYAAIPTRELLLACDAGYPRERLAAQAGARFSAGPYPISTQVFRVEGDRVAVESGGDPH